MAIEKNKTIEDFVKEPLGVLNLIRERKVHQDNLSFQDSKPLLFTLALICGILLIVATYFVLPISQVKAVSVTGNDYLDSQYIENISGVNYRSKYFLTFPSFVSAKVKKDPMVEDCKIRLLPNHIVQIEVKEKVPVGYRYNDQGPFLLLNNGDEVPLTSSYMSMLARLPFISGFDTEDQTHKLTQALSKIDRKMIDEISEIKQYYLDYDEETLEIQMREGGYFFTSYYSIETLNAYHDIYVRMKDHNHCFYAESGKSIVTERACPWDEVPVQHDYWLDEDGNYLTNRWGDKAVKHYYKDDYGNFYLDENGNKIVIPINEFVEDVVDEDFLEHYFAGYYATGTLVIPPPEEEVYEEVPVENQEGAPETQEENDG